MSKLITVLWVRFVHLRDFRYKYLKPHSGLRPGFESLEVHQVWHPFEGAFLIIYIKSSFDVPVMSLTKTRFYGSSFVLSHYVFGVNMPNQGIFTWLKQFSGFAMLISEISDACIWNCSADWVRGSSPKQACPAIGGPSTEWSHLCDPTSNQPSARFRTSCPLALGPPSLIGFFYCINLLDPSISTYEKNLLSS